MYYSLFIDEQEIYETDDYGNIKYTDVIEDGVVVDRIPISAGIDKAHYDTPVPFSSSISSKLNPLQMKAWGVDQSNIWSQINVPKGYLPLEVGALVWRENDIQWEDAEETIPRASSADYTCKGIMTEGLYEDLYLLQRNSSEGKDE
ncbi:MAG: hypothetical protein KBT03_01430 [Bacteroidales bacterium]|nr:hypothetical protein [Candidatus Scybalousia scybalohippi]